MRRLLTLAFVALTLLGGGVLADVEHGRSPYCFRCTGVAAPTAPAGLYSGLAAYFTMNEEGPGARLSSVVETDFFSDGVLAIEEAPGMFGNGAQFSDVTNFYLEGSNASWNQNSDTTGITIALWIYIGPQSAPSAGIFSKSDSSSTFEWLLYLNGSGLTETGLEFDVVGFPGDYSDYSFASLTGVSRLDTNEWHHIIAWWDPADDQAHLYVNGVLQANEGGPNLTSVNPLGMPLAMGSDFGNIGCNCIIDEVAFYNRVLTSEEMDALWNGGTGVALYP